MSAVSLGVAASHSSLLKSSLGSAISEFWSAIVVAYLMVRASRPTSLARQRRRARWHLNRGQRIKRHFDQVVRIDENGDPARGRLFLAISQEIINLRPRVD